MPPYVPVRMKAFVGSNFCVPRDEEALNRNQDLTSIHVNFPECADLEIGHPTCQAAHRNSNDEECRWFFTRRAGRLAVVSRCVSSFRDRLSESLQSFVG